MPIYQDNTKSIGRTPLVRINRLNASSGATILAKIEGRNPAYSVKCRIGSAMVWDAEERGTLRPGMSIVEATSGNTGIALAFAAAARGYGCVLTMPDTMSMERRKVLVAFGAKLVLTPGAKGMKGAIAKAEELAASRAGQVRAHAAIRQSRQPGHPREDHGSGDLGRYGRQHRHLRLGSGHRRHAHRRLALHQGYARQKDSDRGGGAHEFARHYPDPCGPGPTPSPHKIQGIGAGFIPKNLDLSLVDRVEQVSNEEAIATARQLAREEGILCGISCGAAMAVALRLAREPEQGGQEHRRDPARCRRAVSVGRTVRGPVRGSGEDAGRGLTRPMTAAASSIPPTAALAPLAGELVGQLFERRACAPHCASLPAVARGDRRRFSRACST